MKKKKKKVEKLHWPFWMTWKRLSCCKSLPTKAGFELCSQGCVGHALSFHSCFCFASFALFWGPPKPWAAPSWEPPTPAPPAGSFLQGCSPFHTPWHQPGLPTQSHYIRNVTCTVHKWCVGAGTSWGEWRDGLGVKIDIAVRAKMSELQRNLIPLLLPTRLPQLLITVIQSNKPHKLKGSRSCLIFCHLSSIQAFHLMWSFWAGKRF